MPVFSVELGLSFGIDPVVLEMEFNSSSIGSDGVASSLYQDAYLSKTTSRLTRTVWVEMLKHLYAFFADEYPIRRHSFDFMSGFSRISFGMRTFAMVPKTFRWERMGFLPTKISYGVSLCTPFVVQ